MENNHLQHRKTITKRKRFAQVTVSSNHLGQGLFSVTFINLFFLFLLASVSELLGLILRPLGRFLDNFKSRQRRNNDCCGRSCALSYLIVISFSFVRWRRTMINNDSFVALNKFSHKVGKNFWHVEFATKYCYEMFARFKQNNLVSACIRKICVKHGILVHTLFVNPEHVRLLVSLPHNITESKAMQLIKGGSAYLFFRNHPKSRLRLSRGPLWSAGGCATTVEYKEFSTVEHYIKNQGLHHATA